MRSKAPLVMMEQIIMVLVFALASALCLQTFVLSGTISKKIEQENRAALEAQNAAECIKARGLENYIQTNNAEPIKEGYRIFLDEEWNCVTAKQAFYHLDVCPTNSDSDFFWKIDIVITTTDGTELFRIPVAGQAEVMQHE